MTEVINLFGGPGIGKSSLAAEIYYKMKAKHYNVELVREYVKNLAYENKHIGPFDQFYITGKQIKKESSLYNKVDFIITDSPLWLSGFYNEFYYQNKYITSHISNFVKLAVTLGINYNNFFLERSDDIPYNELGRYQNKNDAVRVDQLMKDFLVREEVVFKSVGELQVPKNERADYIIELLKKD